MANVINAQNGMANTADSSSVLHIQTGGTNAIEIDASQNATLVNRLTLPAQKIKVNSIGTQSTPAATVTINLATHTIHTITIAAATTFAFSNVPGAGESQVVYLRITNGGSQAITWPAGATKYAGGTPPTLTTSGVDVLGILYDISTTSYMLFVIGLDVK
jgi:hypothetical protein